jgi:hypothetical protein
MKGLGAIDVHESAGRQSFDQQQHLDDLRQDDIEPSLTAQHTAL